MKKPISITSSLQIGQSGRQAGGQAISQSSQQSGNAGPRQSWTVHIPVFFESDKAQFTPGAWDMNKQYARPSPLAGLPALTLEMLWPVATGIARRNPASPSLGSRCRS